MRNLFSRIIAVILTVTFLFGSAPLSAPAVATGADIITPGENSAGAGVANNDKTPLPELETPEQNEGSDAIEHAYDPFKESEEAYKNAPTESNVDTSSLLVKLDANKAPSTDEIPSEFKKLNVVSMKVTLDVTERDTMELLHVSEPYKWVQVNFAEGESSLERAKEFESISYVTGVEYNYIRKSAAIPSNSKNPLLKDQWYLQSSSVKKAWKYLDDNNLREKLGEIVVAVIDTGVDYTHPNLVKSMWINEDEIPGDGIDNDNNGYIDDYYGASTIGSSFDHNGDPQDEMGHGTHVAGIIGATMDEMGVVGLAYGVKIMAIKAGSGFFNDADIVEAINYAVENGADVINMSFGGYSRSAVVEDALAIAYSYAVLVAAAGNDNYDITMAPMYPAQYNFVLAVMASDENGVGTNFTNYDVIRRNSREYECMAPGTNMMSTLPDNRYAKWSGTSMAAPYVSAVAAILRAKFNNKKEYSTRFIMGQIVGTANDALMKPLGPVAPIAVDVYEALTETPVPELTCYDYYIFDDPAYSEKNNGDGIIDAGETIGLGVLIRNHWGQARNTKVKLIAAMNAIDTVISKNVTWITDTVEYNDVGTFVTASNGFKYDEDGVIIGITDPFLFKVDEKTPNDSYLYFTAVMECEDDDGKSYTFGQFGYSFYAIVRRGVELPRLIDEDMTLKSDTYYILMGSTLIDSGVTLTIEPGTQIQFWGDFSKELYAGQDVAELIVDGELIAEGTAENPIQMFPSNALYDLRVDIRVRSSKGRASLKYCKISNPTLSVTEVDHCYFVQNYFDFMCGMNKDMDGHWYHTIIYPYVYARTISNSIFYELGFRYYNYDYRLDVSGKLYGNLFDSCGLNFNTWNVSEFKDNTFLKNYRLVESQYGDRSYLVSEFNIGSKYQKNNVLNAYCPVKNPTTGSTYFALTTPSLATAETFARTLGGHVVRFETEEEKAFVEEYIKRYLVYNEKLDPTDYGRVGFNTFLIGYFINADGQINTVGYGKEEDYLKRIDRISLPCYNCWCDIRDNEIEELHFYNSSIWVDDSKNNRVFSDDPTIVDNSWCTIIEIPGEISPISVSFETDVITIPSNTENYQLKATLFPAVEGTKLTWSTDDASVATIDADGKITVHSVGTCHATVKIENTDITGEAVIVVTQYCAPTGLSDDETELMFNEYGATKKLTPAVTPANATPIIEFTSSDTSVVMVNSVGVITVVGSGTAEVTAKVSGTDLKVVYKIKSVIPPETLEIKQDFITVALDDNARKQVGYVFTPASATVGTVIYASSDEDIVKVDGNGTLTPVKPGTAYVVISFPDISRILKVKVLVVENSDSVTITGALNSSYYEGAFFSAEDGTTYYLGNANVTGFERLPQNIGIKSKQANFARWWNTSEIIYIDPDNTLKIQNINDDNATVLDHEVAKIIPGSDNYTYYIRMDGTVGLAYHRDNGRWESVNVEILENVRDGYYNGYPMFIDEDGRLLVLVAKNEVSDNEIFWTFSCIEASTKEKFVAFGFYDRFVVAESGKVFNFSVEIENEKINMWLNDDMSAGGSLASSVNFANISDFVYFAPNNDYILLMNDGTVYYYGTRRSSASDYINFNSLLPVSNSRGMYELDLVGTPVKLGRSYFVMSDGAVRTFSNYGSGMLGNGKTNEANRGLTTLVVPQFGCVNNNTNIEFTKTTVKNGGSAASYGPDETDLGTLSNGFEISLDLSKYAFQISERFVYFTDISGKKTAAVIKEGNFGKSITITPAEQLREGYYYTLHIGSGALRDEYANISVPYSLTFRMAGTAVYDVPVTGIEGGGNVEIEYNATAKLSVNVLPADATVKSVIWRSSDKNVAIVNERGVVTGQYNGTATITAETVDGAFTATFTVKVSTPPQSMTVDREYVVLEKGTKSSPITVVAVPYYAEIGDISYVSSDTSIATVDNSGVITAVNVGTTIINVSVSNYDDPITIFVNVTESKSSVTIKSLSNKDRALEFPFFIAEDNTVWYMSGDYSTYGEQYLPRKANFKAKSVSANYYYGRLFYIDTNNTLYVKGGLNSSESEKVAVDVKKIASRDQYAFYIKNDGNVYYYNADTAKTVKCTALTGVVDIAACEYNGVFFMFLSSDGTVRTIKTKALDNGFSAADIAKLKFDEKILLMSGRRLLTETGKVISVYCNDWNSDKTEDWGYENEINEAFIKANKDHITGFVLCDNYTYYTMILLDDGRIMLTNGTPEGFRSAYKETKYNNIYEIIGLTGNTTDIMTNYLLMEDGTVMSVYNGNADRLGNNNKNGKKYNRPVAAWIGAASDLTAPELIGVYATANGTDSALRIDDLNRDLPETVSFDFRFSELLYNLNESVSLMDYSGRSVSVGVVCRNNVITVTPTEPLTRGNLYYLTVSDSTATDYFENPTPYIELTFTTSGTLQFEVPVTAIKANVDNVTVEYNEEIQLSYTITPENASVQRVFWTTSDPSIASVDENGAVIGGRNGTATVTATTLDGSFSCSYTVVVKTPVSSFELSQKFILLDTGSAKTATISAKILPEILSDGQALVWKSSDPSIATVDANGKLTAVSTGITTVTCVCEGVDNTASCVISVVSDINDTRIKKVFSTNDNNYIYATETSLWVASDTYRIPVKVDVSDVKQAFLIEWNILAVLHNDGSFETVDIANGYTDAVDDGVEMIARMSNRAILLKNGSLYGYRNGNLFPELLDMIDGVVAISSVYGDSYAVYALDYNGVVWRLHEWENIRKVFDDEKIVDISYGGGTFMKGESGKFYCISDISLQYMKDVNTYADKIKDIARLKNGFAAVLLNDGTLLFATYPYNGIDGMFNPERIENSEFANSNIYRVNIGSAVVSIGVDWLINSDGYAKMCLTGYGGYFGTGEYSGEMLVSPYFTETDADLNNLVVSSVKVGSETISAIETNTVALSDRIVVSFELPVSDRGKLDLTSIKDESGKVYARDVEIDGKQVVITLKESLVAGETYTLKIFSESVTDIFNHTNGGNLVYTFRVSGSATQAFKPDTSNKYPTTDFSPDHTEKELNNLAKAFYKEALSEYISAHPVNVGNAFLNAYPNPDATTWMELKADGNYNYYADLTGNFWGTTKTDLIDRIITDVKDSFSYAEILYQPLLEKASETAFPFVTGITVRDSEGVITNTVGIEDITVEVSFNRDMDMTVMPFVTFGSDYPYGDFIIEGEWKDARTWVGAAKIYAVTGSGTQYFKVRNAVAADDPWLKTGNDYERFAFVIATSGAKSMSLQASGGDGYIELTWAQDDYDTIAGYNVYRSTVADGDYQKINRSVIKADVASYMDKDVADGVKYYYYFTVVKTDLTESEPSGKSEAASRDMTPPTITHTAVGTAPESSAVPITAYVRDNTRVSEVTLYYRSNGQTEYESVQMYLNSLENNKYTATIPASVLGSNGAEYYIAASDGYQESYRGSADKPYAISTYKLYTITVNVQNGSITLTQQKAREGSIIYIKATPADGYALLIGSLEYSYDSKTRSINDDMFVMPASNVTITATFVEKSDYQQGDVNRDGVVDSGDAVLILKYDAGLIQLENEQIVLADFNGDGKINAYDATLVLEKDAGLAVTW